MEKRQLSVIIAGETGSGKSILALLFEEFLKKKGLNVTMDIDCELFDYGSEEKFRKTVTKTKKERLKAIAENTEITICQRQIIQKPNENES